MKKNKVRISELFLIKADWSRTFMGEIVRINNNDGTETIRGSVIVNEGKIWGVADSDELLGKNLDDICTLKLDHGLHNNFGLNISVAGQPLFIN